MNFPNHLLLDAEMAKARLRETWEPAPAGSEFEVQRPKFLVIARTAPAR
jgi:hypothetical protein